MCVHFRTLRLLNKEHELTNVHENHRKIFILIRGRSETVVHCVGFAVGIIPSGVSVNIKFSVFRVSDLKCNSCSPTRRPIFISVCVLIQKANQLVMGPNY